MNKNIAVLPGDGVGPEITREAILVLQDIAQKFGHTFTYSEGLIGGAAIEKLGTPFPQETKALCLRSDAVLFGAIGDPAYDNSSHAAIRPEQGLLAMREALGLYANIRPIAPFKNFISQSPLKPEITQGVDFIVVRELIGGIYFGKKGRSEDGSYAFDTNEYSRQEIERVAKVAFALAGKRKKHVTLVDKANVLETSRLWRETIQQMQQSYKDVTVDFMFIDNAAMQIVKRPSFFDVIVTENMFGDILTDEASVIVGSIGMLPSASIGEGTSLFEPIHGSFPKAKGLGIANPIGSILSAAMMLSYAFQLSKESTTIYSAVEKVLSQGLGTKDIVLKNPLSTSELAQAIRKEL